MKYYALTFPKKVMAVIFIMLILSVLTSVWAQPPKVVDGNTRFHRVYVTGPGKSGPLGLWHEENGFKDDRDELKGDLEKSGNQGDGSTSQTLEKPSKQQLRDVLDALKGIAQPGDEVTLYFGGHGNGGNGGLNSPDEANDPMDEWIWLNDDGNETQGDEAEGNCKSDDLNEVLTDDELAQMLAGFRFSVTIVVIIDSCYGGGFTGGANDIQENDHVAVIGTSATSPLDPPGIFGGLKSTLTEDIADGGGEREADANEDGIVTAEELKDWLRKRSWDLGPPNDQNPGKIKKGKSKIIGFEGASVQLPSITPNTFTPSPDSNVFLEGKNFASYSLVHIRLVNPDLTQLIIGVALTDEYGCFSLTVNIPSVPKGEYMLFAEDSEANDDWQILSIGYFGVGGISVSIDKLALLNPYFASTSTILVAMVAIAICVKRIRHRKEKQ
ncbi:MAG: caspase family protein [Candidatus Bathyarchaeia archaeon]